MMMDAIGRLEPVLDAARVRQLVERGAALRLLDVRTPAEFEAVHIRGAYNVPLDTLAEHREDLRRHVREPVVLVCRSGQRARRAEEALREIGMQNLHVLDGGLNAWVAAGLAVERGRRLPSLENQVRLIVGTLCLVGGVLALAMTPFFGMLPAIMGAGLVYTGATDSCVMAMALAKLPYNRARKSDVGAVVAALRDGRAAPGAAV